MMGHVVLVAHDGPSALQQVEAFGPQVVLLDVGLPEMDGIEVATRLCAQPGGDRLFLSQSRDGARRKTANAPAGLDSTST